MPKTSSSSVRVFYPDLDRAGLIRILRERLGRLEAKLPLVRVTLFGSYTKGTYTVRSDGDCSSSTAVGHAPTLTLCEA